MNMRGCDFLLLIGLNWLISAAWNKPTVTIRGAGSSFPYLVYKAWINSYIKSRAEYADITINYLTVGSGVGMDMILSDNRDVEFVGTDVMLPIKAYTKYPHLNIFPTLSGMVAIVYNLPNSDSNILTLSREAVVGIFNGTIKYWNDTEIAIFNPRLTLPNEKIKVVIRSGFTGITYMLSKSLSSFSKAWNDTYGTFTDVQDWNFSEIATHTAKSTVEMQGLIGAIHYSIGYLGLADAMEHDLKYAKIQNRDGFAVLPTYQALTSAESNGNLLATQLSSITDNPGQTSYPIAGYTYIVIDTHNMSKDCNVVVEFFRFVKFFLSNKDAVQQAVEMQLSGVHDAVVSLIEKVILEDMYCSGQQVSWLVAQQIRKELALKSEVIAEISTGVLIFSALLVLVLWRSYHKNRNILNNEWLAHKEDFDVQSTPGNFGEINNYKGMKVAALNDFKISTKTQFSWSIRSALVSAQEMSHTNIEKFVCLAEHQHMYHFIKESYNRGNLHQVIQTSNFRSSYEFQISIILDVISGMTYLHSCGIVHGLLSIRHCVVDEKWNVRISDWLESSICTKLGTWETDFYPQVKKNTPVYLSLAPEIIISNNLSKNIPTKRSDSYSFAVLMEEIMSGAEPFNHYRTQFSDVPSLACAIFSGDAKPGCAPHVRQDYCQLISFIAECRPSFILINKKIRELEPDLVSFQDVIMKRMDQHVEYLEKVQLSLEKSRAATENLLNRMLPPSVASDLAAGRRVSAESYECVTIYFSDIVGFTDISSLLKPKQIIQLLNDLYTIFDNTLEKYDVYKVETIGDAYMVVSGLPHRNGHQHVSEIACMALNLMSEVRHIDISNIASILKEKNILPNILIRAGVHSGECMAGVVGTKMPRFCLFGDTVNTASRMESNSLPMHIQMSESSVRLIQLHFNEKFIFEKRGTLEIKGKGIMTTYFLKGLQYRKDSKTINEISSVSC